MQSIDGQLGWEARMLAIRDMGEGMKQAGMAAFLGVLLETIKADVRRVLMASPKVPWDDSTSLFGRLRL